MHNIIYKAAAEHMQSKLKKYLTDEYLRDLIQFYELNCEADHDRLWIIDAVADAPLPINWVSQYSHSHNGRPYYVDMTTNETVWQHPFDAFYQRFLQIYEATFEKAQMTCEEKALSRRPPRMIRDILSMAAYYGLSPDDWAVFWPVLIAIACDLRYLKWKYDSDALYWTNNGVACQWHPTDVFLSQLCAQALACPDPYVFPQLTPVEGRLIPERSALVWSFLEMRCYIISDTDIPQYRSMRPPSMQRLDSFVQTASELEFLDIDNISRNYRIFPIELYYAWDVAGARVYSGLCGAGRYH